MTLVQRCTLIILCSLTWTVSANTALYQHAQAVGQTMSALYMQGLSEGNAKYERDLEFFKQQASETLVKYLKGNPKNSDELLGSWNTLKTKIKATYSQEFGWDVDSAVRRDFRTYLSVMYQRSLAEIKPDSPALEQYQFALVQMESVIARFFDISSVYNGTYSLSNSDLSMLDPKTVSEEFKQSIDTLMKLSGKGQTSRDLKSAKYKWEFIEESVVNYSDQSAFFLVYATKNKIQKVLSAGQVLLTDNN
jgi:hypothetical protein